jgi:hypothetical protein
VVRIDVRKDRLIVRFKSAGTEEGSHSADDQIFVSVTQQFNTTTSMGRLTLNVLLSFEGVRLGSNVLRLFIELFDFWNRRPPEDGGALYPYLRQP